MIASVAGTMMHRAAKAMEFGANSRTCLHLPRPTDHAEALRSGDGVTGKPIHI